jgi:hypothetical protein
VAADPNCVQNKNCALLGDGNTCSTPIRIAGIEPVAVSNNPTFDFTLYYNGQWLVMTVMSVTSL